MCMPKAPAPPPPPAQRQTMKVPNRPTMGENDPQNRRRRGYAALMSRAAGASLQPPATTSTLGG